LFTFLTASVCAQIQNQPDGGQWTMPAQSYASTSYSSLDQINNGNVKNLKLIYMPPKIDEAHKDAPQAKSFTDHQRCSS